jgi:hypothetical protein
MLTLLTPSQTSDCHKSGSFAEVCLYFNGPFASRKRLDSESFLRKKNPYWSRKYQFAPKPGALAKSFTVHKHPTISRSKTDASAANEHELRTFIEQLRSNSIRQQLTQQHDLKSFSKTQLVISRPKEQESGLVASRNMRVRVLQN